MQCGLLLCVTSVSSLLWCCVYYGVAVVCGLTGVHSLDYVGLKEVLLLSCTVLVCISSVRSVGIRLVCVLVMMKARPRLPEDRETRRMALCLNLVSIGDSAVSSECTLWLITATVVYGVTIPIW